jgi:hypothetical protein
MRKFMKITGQSINDVRHSTTVNTQAIFKLEIQVGQLASHLGERDKGKLPSQLVNNPKACTIGSSSIQEHAHAIVTLRSRRRVDNHVVEPEAEPTIDLSGKKKKRVTRRRPQMLSHLQSLPWIITPRGCLSQKPHILRD